MPSNLDVQIMTLLSAPPDANLLPVIKKGLLQYFTLQLTDTMATKHITVHATTVIGAVAQEVRMQCMVYL